MQIDINSPFFRDKNKENAKYSKITSSFVLRKEGKYFEAFDSIKDLLPCDLKTHKLSVQRDKALTIALSNIALDICYSELKKDKANLDNINYFAELLNCIDATGDDRLSARIQACLNKCSVINSPKEAATKKSFALRKEHKLIEALDLLLPYLPKDYPNEKIILVENEENWFNIAFYLVVTDLIKNNIENNTRDNLDYYLSLLSGIDAENDVKKQYVIDKCKRESNPHYKSLSNIRDLPKEGDQSEAIKLYLQYKDKTQDSLQDLNLGWRIYYQIKYYLSQNMKNVAEVRNLLRTYLKLDIKKSDNINLHKSILLQVKLLYRAVENKDVKVIGGRDFNFVNFFYLWGFKRLDEISDTEWQDSDGYQSLPVSCIQLAAKCLVNDKNVNLNIVKSLIPYIHKAIKFTQDKTLLEYYLSKLYKIQKNYDLALEYAFKVLKEKKQDWWIWKEIASIYSLQENINYSIAFLCRALLCNATSDSTLEIHKKLANELFKNKEYDDFKFEIDKYLELKSKDDVNVINSLKHNEFYQKAISPKSHDDFYKKRASLTDEILYSEMPYIDAILGDKRSFKIKREGVERTKTRRILFIKDGSKTYKVEVPESSYRFNTLKVNSSLELKGNFDKQNYKFNLFVVKESKKDNKAILNEQYALIYNIHNNLAFGLLNNEENFALPLNNVNNVKVGDVVKVQRAYSFNKKQNKEKLEVVSLKKEGNLKNLAKSLYIEVDAEVVINLDSDFKYKAAFINLDNNSIYIGSDLLNKAKDLASYKNNKEHNFKVKMHCLAFKNNLSKGKAKYKAFKIEIKK